MCNIAGYAGHRQAAPILLEMLRRQQPYDGDTSTGVAVIHEGKLYYRSIVGDVDALIRETDVLELPGTLGIAHTRPGANKAFPPMHPNISRNGKMALVTNGTTPMTKYSPGWSDAVNVLDADGYARTGLPDPKKGSGFISGSYDTRIAGIMADYRKLMRLGIPGLKDEIRMSFL